MKELKKLKTLEDLRRNLFGEDCKDEFDVMFKPLCTVSDYKKNKDKLKNVQLQDILHVQKVLKCGGDIEQSIDAVTQLNKISMRNNIGMISLIDLMNELRSVLSILEK